MPRSATSARQSGRHTGRHTAPPPRPDPAARRRRRTGLTARLAVVAALLGGAAAVTASSAAAAPGDLYVDSATSAGRWVAANPSDPRAAEIRERVATVPVSRWFSSYSPSTIRTDVAAYVGAADRAGQVPQVIAYMIPNRDCGGPSAGGAPSWSAYDAWVDAFAAGLGSRRVIVMLEPDSLALQGCVDGAEVASRNRSIGRAVDVVQRANPAAEVYLDAGHSAWNPPAETASRLRAAGVLRSDGFYSNMSNYRRTADEAAFGQQVLAALGRPAGLGQVIDIARNGNGPKGTEWCDPTGRAIGAPPTLASGLPDVDALLWAKPPGEADGCRAGAGQFVPDLALELIRNATGTPTVPSPRPSSPTTPPTVTPTVAPAPTSTTPASTTSAPAGTGTCTATLRRAESWPDGHRAEIRVSAPAAATGWRLTWTVPSGTTVSTLWGGRYQVSGDRVTVGNEPWNASVGPATTATVGFVADGTALPSAITCRTG